MNRLFSDLTVVVVTYNSEHCVADLVPLLSQCPHVVFSDNGSADGTVAAVRRQLPHARVLEHHRNLGFGAANNAALASLNTPLALLLNPDCVVQVDQLAALMQAAERFPEAAIVAPQIMTPSGAPDVNYRWVNHLWASRGPQAEGPVCVGFVCGAVMLFRLARFQSVGFFDETFFLYYEDDDLCTRLTQAQIPIVVDPEVKAVHRNRGSVKGKQVLNSEYIRGYHHAQSKLIYQAKHIGLVSAQAKRTRLLLLTTLALPFRCLAFSPKHIVRMVGRWMGAYRWKSSGPTA